MSKLKQLAELIQSAHRGVAFTGAGISTESGLSDFRSPGGIWAKNAPVLYDEFVASREARARYWSMRLELHKQIDQAKPNDGHLALAEFERQRHIVAVVTQNIDGLHQDAKSLRVIELHGTARVIECIACHRQWTPSEIVKRIRSGDEAPDCDDCGKPLKSKTISFGQAMPVLQMQEAAEVCSHADLCLAIGSSLVVEPAASFPRMALQNGAKLVIINNTQTPLDHQADLILREPIGQVLRQVLALIPH